MNSNDSRECAALVIPIGLESSILQGSYGSLKMKFPDFCRFSLTKMIEFPDFLDVKNGLKYSN